MREAEEDKGRDRRSWGGATKECTSVPTLVLLWSADSGNVASSGTRCWGHTVPFLTQIMKNVTNCLFGRCPRDAVTAWHSHFRRLQGEAWLSLQGFLCMALGLNVSACPLICWQLTAGTLAARVSGALTVSSGLSPFKHLLAC